MTLEEWIKNNRGLPGGQDLSTEFLEKIYHRIVKEEIKMDTDINGGNSGNTIGVGAKVEKQGYLIKQGGRIKTWKRRWFVLRDNCLYYFKTSDAQELLGFLPLENLSVRALPDNKAKRKWAFEIYQPDVEAEMKAIKFDSKGMIYDSSLFCYPHSFSFYSVSLTYIYLIYTS